MARAVVTHFYRPIRGYPIVHAMTVIAPITRNDGSPSYSRTEYDVEWSEKLGYYLFNQSGAGGGGEVTVSGLYHVSGEANVIQQPTQWVQSNDRPPWRGRGTRLLRKANRTRRLNLPPKQIQLAAGQDMLDWMEGNGANVDAVWCRDCNSHVRGDYLCEHTWWCDRISWYSTPSERCNCGSIEECAT